MEVYEAIAQRDGNFWFVQIPELDLFTQARTVEEIDGMARDVGFQEALGGPMG